MLIPRSRLFRTFLFAMMVSLTVEADAMAKRAIPDDNLAYPVLIILKNRSTGSEFYLNADKATYLITAKHVLYNPSTNKLLDKNVSLISYSADLSNPNRNFVALDLSVLEANGNIRVQMKIHSISGTSLARRMPSARKSLLTI